MIARNMFSSADFPPSLMTFTGAPLTSRSSATPSNAPVPRHRPSSAPIRRMNR